MPGTRMSALPIPGSITKDLALFAVSIIDSLGRFKGSPSQGTADELAAELGDE